MVKQNKSQSKKAKEPVKIPPEYQNQELQQAPIPEIPDDLQPQSPPPPDQSPPQSTTEDPDDTAETHQAEPGGPFSSKKEDLTIPAEVEALPILKQIAALLYYAEGRALGHAPGELPDFEQADRSFAKTYVWQAANFIIALGKLNMKIMPVRDVEADFEVRIRRVDDLELLIQTFNKEVKSPAKVAQFYPARELAMRIVDGVKK